MANKTSNQKADILSAYQKANIVSVYTVTEEEIANAASYVPTIMKMAFVKYAAERCFDTLDISVSNGNGSANALPSRYKVNTDKKSRYLMAALVGMYLGKNFEREDDGDKDKKDKDVWLMSIREYDMYAGGHIFEMLNRMKSNNAIRDKCFDILSDYSELKYRLDTEIKGLMDAMNDSASRILAYIEASSSPESMKEAIEQFAQNQNLLDTFMEKREHEMKEAIAEEAAGVESAIEK